jgi:hypothetical protein
MNKFELNKVIKKYNSHYYHVNSKYAYEPEIEKHYYVLNCDHIEIVYDMMPCDIQESDTDFVWNSEISYDINILELKTYIVELEKNKNIKKALIHLGWYFKIQEKDIIDYFYRKNYLDKIFQEPMKTFVESNIKNYELDLSFRKMSDAFKGMMKAISNDNK